MVVNGWRTGSLSGFLKLVRAKEKSAAIWGLAEWSEEWNNDRAVFGVYHWEPVWSKEGGKEMEKEGREGLTDRERERQREREGEMMDGRIDLNGDKKKRKTGKIKNTEGANEKTELNFPLPAAISSFPLIFLLFLLLARYFSLPCFHQGMMRQWSMGR